MPTADTTSKHFIPAHELLKTASSLVGRAHSKFMLCIADEILELPVLTKPKVTKPKIILAVSNEVVAAQAQEQGFRVVNIPAFAYSRLEKVKVALVAAFANGLVSKGDVGVCVTGIGQKLDGLDTIMMLTVGDEKLVTTGQTAWTDLTSIADDIPVQVLEIILNLALSIGQEGFEGHPIGTIIVIGDSTAVMEKSRQLHLNPFQGYSEVERNIMDPSIRQAVKYFTMLDGATIVREDGVVLASGRHLDSSDVDGMGLGLGARHQAAASITASTDAITVVVSQTTGEVRLFKKGKLRLEIQTAHRRTIEGNEQLKTKMKKG